MAAFSAGAGASLLAWTASSNWAIGVLLVLPILWSASRSRLEAGGLYFGYILGGTHDLPSIVCAFFPTLPFAASLGLWLAAASVLAAPWCALWQRRMRPLRAACGCAGGVLLVTLPPLGIIGWLTPIALAGQLFPGWGFGGALMTWATLAALAGAGRLGLVRAAGVATGLLVGTAAISLFANTRYVPPSTPIGWRTLDTHVGRYPTGTDLLGRLAWHETLAADVDRELSDPELRVLVLPEEILGQRDSLVVAGWAPIASEARARGVVVLAGVDLPLAGGGYVDSLWNVSAGEPVAAARIPMPLGQWRPWSARSSPLNLALGQQEVVGVRPVGVSFCFEDFLFWIQALTVVGQRPAVLISVANNWFDTGADAQQIQRRHIELWARLFGLPLIRSTNWGDRRGRGEGFNLRN